jgi:hypothetical protein
MADSRECPLCGGAMRKKRIEAESHIPGHKQSTRRTITEWVCPDCDYFEEADEE